MALAGPAAEEGSLDDMGSELNAEAAARNSPHSSKDLARSSRSLVASLSWPDVAKLLPPADAAAAVPVPVPAAVPAPARGGTNPTICSAAHLLASLRPLRPSCTVASLSAVRACSTSHGPSAAPTCRPSAGSSPSVAPPITASRSDKDGGSGDASGGGGGGGGTALLPPRPPRSPPAASPRGGLCGPVWAVPMPSEALVVSSRDMTEEDASPPSPPSEGECCCCCCWENIVLQ
mmetsp:Transcript_1835/g.4038  ORF Transcript_1835/g.4038 Transcript_1835/m.4038 type:complete len:233 (-) Transcript_1835:182-880(-)